jgi:hypothetical protein
MGVHQHVPMIGPPVAIRTASPGSQAMVLAMAPHATPPVSMQGATRPSGACLLVWRLHVDEVLELSTA